MAPNTSAKTYARIGTAMPKTVSGLKGITTDFKYKGDIKWEKELGKKAFGNGST